MKTRKFEIKNYDIGSKVKSDLMKSLEKLEFRGADVFDTISVSTWKIPKDIKKYDEEYQKELVAYFKAEYEIKKEETIKNYDIIKKHVAKVLFDDKDYIELSEVLEDNYYCQATTMLQDLLERKTKGKTVKAMKYQARVMQINDTVNCD